MFKNTYFEEHLCNAASELPLQSHLKPSQLSNITKYQSLLNQSFKQNLL